MRTLLAFLSLLFVASASSPADPASVLVVVQDNTAPETGTGGANAGQYVADYYMTARGIPEGNIVHISTFIERGDGVSCAPGGPVCDLAHSGSYNISYQSYLDNVQAPIVAKLNANSGALANSIKYIVMTYGVPVTIQTRTMTGLNGPETYTGLSIDNTLAALNQAQILGFYYTNPYYVLGSNGVLIGNPASTPAHLTALSLSPRFYAVVRLDGPSAMIAKGLVDKAIQAETDGINMRSGTGYFDWQGIGSSPTLGTSNQRTDATMKRAYDVCVTHTGWVCTLNNQQESGGLIMDAPNTLWFWGWYTLATNDIYTFASGAVGVFLNSNSAIRIRSQIAGAYVPLWLSRGITATAGVTSEPFLTEHPYGDTLLAHLWSGYTFGEACYLSIPHTNWMSICVGDPLYLPKFTGPSHITQGVKIVGGSLY